MKKVFVTGSKGMVGSRFVELHRDKYKLLTPEIDELDLTDRKAVVNYVKTREPDVIVHFAAYTDVSGAESQRGDSHGSCYKVNVEATRNLLESIQPKLTHFIHISTDMVFSGSKDDPGPYDVDHKPETDFEKLTWYGYTKKLGENAVKKFLGQNYSILRLIYPVRAGYEKKLDPQVLGRLKLYDEGNLYPLFDDQYISITDIDEACQALEKIIQKKAYGVFHAGSKDVTNPYELGLYLIETARGRKNAVERGSFDQYSKKIGSSVRWPKYGGLSVKTTEKKLGICYSGWKEIIDKIVVQRI